MLKKILKIKMLILMFYTPVAQADFLHAITGVITAIGLQLQPVAADSVALRANIQSALTSSAAIPDGLQAQMVGSRVSLQVQTESGPRLRTFNLDSRSSISDFDRVRRRLIIEQTRLPGTRDIKFTPKVAVVFLAATAITLMADSGDARSQAPHQLEMVETEVAMEP